MFNPFKRKKLLEMTTIEKFQKELKRISVNNCTFNISGCTGIDNDNALLLILKFDNVKDSITGFSGFELKFTQLIHKKQLDFLPTACYELAMRAYMHECNDSFKVDGKQVMNPHIMDYNFNVSDN